MNHPSATRSSLGRRTAAFLIDAVIALVATSILLGFFIDPESTEPVIEPELAGLITIIFISICFNYFAIAEWRWGQTIGKNMLGIRVLDANGGKLSWNASSIRNLLRLVDVFAIGPILIGRDGRRLGDRAAKTIVVPEAIEAKNFGFTAATAAPGGVGGLETSASPPTSGSPEPEGSSDREDGVPATWNVATVGLGIVTALGLILVGTIVVGAFDPTLETQAGTAAAQAVFALALIGTAVFFAGRGGEGERPEDRGSRSAVARLGIAGIDGRVIRLAVLGWGAYLLLAAAIAPLLQPEQDGIARELDDVSGTLAIIIAGILIVIAAPLSEEIFFRGFIFGGLRNSVPFWAAAIVSSAIWGSLHLTGGNIGVVVQLTVFGLVLAWLYERSGSLWTPLIAHTINNAIAYTLLVTEVI